MRMPIILAALFILVGCGEGSVRTPNVVDSDQQAIELAWKYVESQSRADSHKKESAQVTQNSTEYTVYFEIVGREHIMPNRSVVIVDKKTGQTKWFPIR